MKAMSKFWTALVVGVAVMAVTIPSWAGPLMPNFPASWNVGDAVAGQSTLNVSSGTGDPIYVDWIVVFWGNVGPSGQPVWGYYYQIENPQTQPDSEKTVAILTISTLGGPPFFAAGFVADTNLDTSTTFADPFGFGYVPGHTAANYSNLVAEFEPSPGDIQNPTGVSGPTAGGVTYYFGPPPTKEIALGNQSTLLYAYAFVPPMYGIATAQDSDVQWRGLVPVPSPEPGTVVLFVLGTVGMGILSRRYRRK
jgi:hypothetical protein